MPEFDPIIHQAVRLKIMSALAVLKSGDSIDFTYLKNLLGLTDGNLGAHLDKLTSAGYLKADRTNAGRNAKMFIELTAKGRGAFEGHRKALEEILRGEE